MDILLSFHHSIFLIYNLYNLYNYKVIPYHDAVKINRTCNITWGNNVCFWLYKWTM